RARAIRLNEPEKLARGCDRLLRDRRDALEEVSDPPFPIACRAHAIEAAVVFRPMAFEVEAEIEEGLREESPILEEERHQEPSDAPVAIEERVNRLELHVKEARSDERRQIVVRVDVALER